MTMKEETVGGLYFRLIWLTWVDLEEGPLSECVDVVVLPLFKVVLVIYGIC